MPRGKDPKKPKEAKNYNHADSENPMRPEVGTEPAFKKRKPPVTYRYDSSLSPALDWDENPAREEAEALIARILEAGSLEEAKAAANKLRKMSQPFLNWTGKADRSSFEVPTLPLFVHERLSTRAIIETLKTHKKGGDQLTLFNLFNDPQWSITDQVLKAYEYQDKWVNRMILGDSLTVMNSLVQYEGLGGKVQMIYMDPPYGVKFGSNFQPFVKKRDVKHNDDEDLTREPEMVQAYRDTWELGLHSYLSYLRDRLLLARELLTESGSVFVQISDENVHHVRELMDEVFGKDNFCGLIQFAKTSGLSSNLLYQICDFVLWYAKDKISVKYHQIYSLKVAGEAGAYKYNRIELPNGERRQITSDERSGLVSLPKGTRFWVDDNLTSQGNPLLEFIYKGKKYKGTYKTNIDGLQRLAKANRLYEAAETLRFIRYLDDFPAVPLNTAWMDVGGIQSRSDPKIYVVQTSNTAIQRCILMTTEPGDLVLDITCGSGTTAYVAEQWGRRWITCDISRVPLALARQRLLTATFPYYQLKDESRGPAGGFVYKRKQNSKGEEVGGIVPHITLKSIANNEPPAEEILVDRPEELSNIVRVCGPFTVEGTIPPPVDLDGQDQPETEAMDNSASFTDRMLEVLRKSPVLRLPNNESVSFTNVRQPVRSQSLNAEAMVDDKPVAFVFGPENGAVAERLVFEAAREAGAKNYSHLYVIGFAIAANARQLVENCQAVSDIPATYVQATPDLLMSDLLKSMKSSQIFSVCGLPEVKVRKLDDGRFQVELLGLDVFDPTTMEVDHLLGKNVPAWFLDTDYNSLCFHVNQAFFPRTNAWDSLQKALKGTYEESVWEHLAGTISTPFEAGEHQQIAVKVIDDRGNELLVVKSLEG